jgi:hypothetical protein
VIAPPWCPSVAVLSCKVDGCSSSHHSHHMSMSVSGPFHFSSIDSKCLARRRLYSCFDGLVERMDVFKVETIGDAYMATTNVVKDQHDHAERLIRWPSFTPPSVHALLTCCCLTHSISLPSLICPHAAHLLLPHSLNQSPILDLSTCCSLVADSLTHSLTHSLGLQPNA